MTAGVAHDVCLLPAVEQRRLLRERSISSAELVESHIATIERCNPAVNAIVTETFDLARERAAAADAELAGGGDVGPLHGLPVAHKDFTPTAGIRTTLGSPLHAGDVPTVDALIVERLRRAGAVTLGKTNTPEFAAGSQTYNSVFGATRNPYDLRLTSGGSSGGAAAALACGMVAIADGSDMGGSLRNPASFCNVVGLRPTPGRVPVWPSAAQWDPLSVQGPMGRTVADVAMQFEVIAGPDPRAPLALGGPVSDGSPLKRDLGGLRAAWSRDLGGLPVEAGVTAVLEEGRPVLDALGMHIAEAEPDWSGADVAFTRWRAWLFELSWGHHYDDDRDQLGEDVRWNIEQGRVLTGPQLAEAERARAALFHRLRAFFEDHDVLLAPVVQVLPFPVEQHWPAVVAGVGMETYIDWMRSCWYVSAAGLPAASVPFGFTPEGLPVGLQVVGPHGCDWRVLQVAHAIEREVRCHERHPAVATGREA